MNTHIASFHDRWTIPAEVPVLRGPPGTGLPGSCTGTLSRFSLRPCSAMANAWSFELGRRILLLARPADVHDGLILNAAEFERSTEVKNLRPVFGDGLYSSEGERWRKQRRLVQPAFHHARITRYSSAIMSYIKASIPFRRTIVVLRSSSCCEILLRGHIGGRLLVAGIVTGPVARGPCLRARRKKRGNLPLFAHSSPLPCDALVGITPRKNIPITRTRSVEFRVALL
jgi:hypothetical protein